MASPINRLLYAGLLGPIAANGLYISPRADDKVAKVDLGKTTGTPEHLASGFMCVDNRPAAKMALISC